MLYGLYEQELAPSDYFILQKYTDTWSVRYKDIGRVIHSYKQMIKCQNDQWKCTTSNNWPRNDARAISWYREIVPHDIAK